MSRHALGGLTLLLVLSLAFTSYAAAAPGDTVRVSRSWEGGGAEGVSSEPSISADGRYVAFTSTASNVISSDANEVPDVFVYDRQDGSVELASPGEVGQANGSSGEPSISADGRYVAFSSSASNLVPGDTNGRQDVFVFDRKTGTVERVSVGQSGMQGNGVSREPSINQDGSAVAFFSSSTNLASGPVPILPHQNVYVRDLGAGETSLVSVGEGSGANGVSRAPSIDGVGDRIAFESQATNLSPMDTSGQENVYLFERPSLETELVSVGDGGEAADASSFGAAISEYGNVVAFASGASNLVAGDANSTTDVFAFEPETSGLELVSVGKEGEAGDGPSSSDDTPAISADGRYVAFSSTARNLFTGFPGFHDVYRHDRSAGTTDDVSVSSGGLRANGTSREPAIDGDGETVAFQSYASDLVPNDENHLADVFVHEPGGEPAAPDVVSLDDFTGSGAPLTQPEALLGPAYAGVSVDLNPGSLEPDFGLTSLTEAVFHFDDDFSFDAAGIPACEEASLTGPGPTGTGITTTEAIAACPESRIGSGYFEGTPGEGIITLFNGVPDEEGNPTLLAHVRYVAAPTNVEITTLRTGTFRPSSRAGDFGTELDLETAAPGLKHLELTLGGEPVAGHRFVQARCGDPDRTWNFASEYTLHDGLYVLPQTISTEATQQCGVTADSDADGIEDTVDSNPAESSTRFDDGEGTGGEIVGDGGLDVTVADAPAPQGVFVRATEGAGGPASLSVCGGEYTLELAPGAEELVTCGSVIVQVVQGTGTVSVAGGSIVVSVPVGGEAEVADNGDGTYSVQNKGKTEVTVSSGGVDQDVGIGESTTANEPPSANIALSPAAATRAVSTSHTVTATVRGEAGNVLPHVPVRFTVAGSVSAEGSCETDAAGACSFTYEGPEFPGADEIHAYADSDGSGSHDKGEPVAETATVAWILPEATPGQVTGGGQVTSEAGDRVTFGFEAKSRSQGFEGSCNLVDPVSRIKLRCDDVTSMTVGGDEATIYGNATIGDETTNYRIHIEDLGEPGRGSDTFAIHTASGYRAGGTLTSGNVQVH